MTGEWAVDRLDLDAYLDRIGVPGGGTLAEVHRAHLATIPFENLDVLLGTAIDIAPAAIEDKLVRGTRGGYCFEHNGYLLEVLRALGFDVRPLSARVRIGRARESTPPRTHTLVEVTIDAERLLADVGVGALSPTASLRLDVESEQTTPHEPRRLVREGAWSGDLRDPRARVFHQARLGAEWVDVAELTLEEMPEIDREIANWFTSASPRSHFRGRLVVARATEDGRVTILNDELTLRGADGIGRSRKLATATELEAALDEHFGIRLPAAVRAPMPPY
jgi:N-hydroxyarylamine O-acetyltransferase